MRHRKFRHAILPQWRDSIIIVPLHRYRLPFCCFQFGMFCSLLSKRVYALIMSKMWSFGAIIRIHSFPMRNMPKSQRVSCTICGFV
jgi:hypothetical protein